MRKYLNAILFSLQDHLHTKLRAFRTYLEDVMARRRSGVEEIFGEAAIDFGWSKNKQLEVLLAFIEEQELEAELDDYLEEVGSEESTEEVERDPFNAAFDDDED